MKSFTLAAALLASAAVAQPHGHHHHQHDKRELVVEIETAWVTATVIIGDEGTSTIPPPVAPAAATSTGAEFFEPSTTAAPTTLIPQVAPSPSPAASSPSTEAAAPAPQATTQQAAPVVESPSPVVEAAPVASTSTAAPVAETPAASSGSGSGSSGGSHTITKTGDVTYYDVGMGSCGYDDSAVNDTGMIAAISADVWNSISTATNLGVDQPAHPLCNKKVTITAGGKSVQVTVRDKCPGCDANSIDITQAAFKELYGGLGGGRLIGTWSVSW